MKKNIFIIILILIIGFIYYTHLSNKEKFSNLELELDSKNGKIVALEEKLRLREREIKATEALANLWTERAYEFGYDPSIKK